MIYASFALKCATPNVLPIGSHGLKSRRYCVVASRNSGTAASYDIRYANSVPITEGGWSSATQAVGETTPLEVSTDIAQTPWAGSKVAIQKQSYNRTLIWCI